MHVKSLRILLFYQVVATRLSKKNRQNVPTDRLCYSRQRRRVVCLSTGDLARRDERLPAIILAVAGASSRRHAAALLYWFAYLCRAIYFAFTCIGGCLRPLTSVWDICPYVIHLPPPPTFLRLQLFKLTNVLTLFLSLTLTPNWCR